MAYASKMFIVGKSNYIPSLKKEVDIEKSGKTGIITGFDILH